MLKKVLNRLTYKARIFSWDKDFFCISHCTIAQSIDAFFICEFIPAHFENRLHIRTWKSVTDDRYSFVILPGRQLHGPFWFCSWFQINWPILTGSPSSIIAPNVFVPFRGFLSLSTRRLFATAFAVLSEVVINERDLLKSRFIFLNFNFLLKTIQFWNVFLLKGLRNTNFFSELINILIPAFLVENG